MITEKIPENANIYYCESCNFKSSKKSNYDIHLTTAKHKRITNGDTKQSIKSHICQCGKEFKYRQGLYRHRKNCNHIQSQDNTTTEDIDKNEKYEMIIEMLVKENKEFKQLIIDQNKKMMEMTENMGNNHHNTTNTNTNSHNKFNLNVFLNEQCKDAMTLKDFVKNIEISMEEFIETGEIGFVEGVSQSIIKRINDMDLHDRPIHCTDLKRETVYIKDEEKWEKDQNKEKFRKAVKGVARKNERMRPIWYENTPNAAILGSEDCDKFFKYSAASLGGASTEQHKTFEDKIMRNVLKEVTIDKHMKIE